MSRKILLAAIPFIFPALCRGEVFWSVEIYCPVDTVQIDSLPFRDFKSFLDSSFSLLDTSYITTGILLEKGSGMINPSLYSGDLSKDSTLTYTAYGALLSDLCRINPHRISIPFSGDSILKLRNAYLNDSMIAPISILNVKYNTIKTTALADSLFYLQNGKLHDVLSRTVSPYLEKRAFAASSLKEFFYNGTVTFMPLKSSLYFTNDTAAVTLLQIDFDDGNGYISASFGSPHTVTYDSAGDRRLKVRIYTLSDTLTSQFTIAVGAHTGDPAPSSQSFSAVGPDVRWSVNSTVNRIGNDHRGDLDVWFGCGNSSVKKPILIVEGWDPGNDRNAQEIFSIMGENTTTGSSDVLPIMLGKLGYDIAVLNFGDGGDFIQNNSEVFKQAIRKLNSEMNNESEITVIGASMGGVVAKYGIKEMEDANENHNVGTYISFDAPHRGANFSIGIQSMARFYRSVVSHGIGEIVFWIIGDPLRVLDAPASKQLLTGFIDENGFGHFPDNLRTDLMNEHRNYTGSNALPLQTHRNVALLDGALDGSTQAGLSAGDQIVHATFSFALMNATSDIFATPAANTSNFLIADQDYLDLNIWSWFITGTIWQNWKMRVTNLPPLDNAAGGSLYVLPGIRDGINSAGGGCDIFGHDYMDFVPTYSALDLDPSFINSNVISTRPPTPFDSYFGNVSTNSPHIEEQNNELREPFTTLIDREIMPIDLFLQNRTLTAKVYEAAHSVTAGRNVIPSSWIVTNYSYQNGDVLVNSPSIVSCHAGNSVTFEDGFHAASGSVFHAFIQGVGGVCPSLSFKKKNNATPPVAMNSAPPMPITLTIIPNPSSTFISVLMRSENMVPEYQAHIFDILGNEMHVENLDANPINQNEITQKINVTSLASGSYILNVTFRTGQIINRLFTVVK